MSSPHNSSDRDSDVYNETGDITRALRVSFDADEEFNSSHSTGSITREIRNCSTESLSPQDTIQDDNESEVNTNASFESRNSEHDNGSTLHSNASNNFLEANSTFNHVQSIDNSYADHIHGYINSSSDNEIDYEELFNDENEPNVYYAFSKLTEMLASEDSNTNINARFVVNKAEMLLAILSFAKKYCLNNSGITDLCKMLNTFVDQKVVPDTRYMIDRLFYPKENQRYYAVCPQCKNYVGAFNLTDKMKYCEVCEEYFNLKDPSYRDFFVTLDIESEIKHLLENNCEYYTTLIDQLRERRNTNVLRDIHDGQCYRNFYDSLPIEKKNSFASLTFNSDGIRVFKSSKYSGWPIHVTINEVPVHVRNHKQIVYAMWFGRDKPNMTYFLPPFVNEINRLSMEGVSCRLNNNIINIYVYGICCCVDSVARAPMQGTTQFNGYYGCNWCLHPGKRVRHDKGYTIKYPLLDEIPARRSADETIQKMHEAVNNGNPICGIRKVSPLINLEHFNIIDGFVPDPMHCIDLGVAQQLSDYWFSTSGKPYTISKRWMDSIDSQITCLKVPTQIARLSRSIYDRHYWKAREWHNWLLFYSLPLLSQVPNFQEYVEHLSWLVEAYQWLLQPSISLTNLQTAEKLFKKFVAYTEYFYGEDAMTFNIHQLLHISQSVVDWGPLWAHFGYPFESSNGEILENIHAAKGVLSQVCRHLSFNRSIILLQNHISLQEFSEVSNFCCYLQNLITRKSTKIGGVRYFGKPAEVCEIIITALSLPRDETQAYCKIVRDRCVFKGSSTITYRSDNTFAQLKNGTFIQIEQFVIDRRSDQHYTVYREVQVQNIICDSLQSLQQVNNISPEFRFQKTEDVEKLCVCMKVNNKRFIAAVPNMYWY